MRGDVLFFLRSGIFLSMAIPVTVIDIRTLRIPNVLVLVGLLLLFCIDSLLVPRSLPHGVIAGGFAFALFWLIRKISGGMGYGDVKYSSFVAFYAGLRALPFVLLITAFTALSFAFYLVFFCGRSSKDRIPFAPFLSLGGFFGAVCANFGELCLGSFR